MHYAIGLFLSFGALFIQPSLAAEDEYPHAKMRTVDRDWEYFKTIPCDEINQQVFHSRSEELLLAKRKGQCMGRYKVFYTKPAVE